MGHWLAGQAIHSKVQVGEKVVEIDGIDVSPSEIAVDAVDVGILPSMGRKHGSIGKTVDVVDVVGFFPILRFLVCINGLSSQHAGAGNRRQYQRRFLQPFSAL